MSAAAGSTTGAFSAATRARSAPWPGRAVNSPRNAPSPGSGWPAPSASSPMSRLPACSSGTPRHLAQGRPSRNMVPAVTCQRIGTRPRTGWISRASSAQGNGPFAPWFIESVTRTVPAPVVNVVSSTLVPGR